MFGVRSRISEGIDVCRQIIGRRKFNSVRTFMVHKKCIKKWTLVKN